MSGKVTHCAECVSANTRPHLASYPGSLVEERGNEPGDKARPHQLHVGVT